MFPTAPCTPTLVVVHYHFRPGGVRRVIERTLPGLLRLRRVRSVFLLSGERPERGWLSSLKTQMPGTSIRVFSDPSLGYLSETSEPSRALRKRIQSVLRRVTSDAADPVVWFHNPGLGRNLILTDEVAAWAEASEIPTVFHHHDFWFENRWQRWPEMRASGFRTLRHVAETVFPQGKHLRAATINGADESLLGLTGTSSWLPNPAPNHEAPTTAQIKQAGRWLRNMLGDAAPVWIAPTRMLRRKNLAEAILLTRWLQPEGWLVSTAGVSSAGEEGYARWLSRISRRGGWRVKLCLLDKERKAPPVPALIAASEAVIMTSLQEGFGLPLLEAAAHSKPLLARFLPNIIPDLQKMGFHFPHLYDEMLIPETLFDLKREIRRQDRLGRAWRKKLPRICQDLVCGLGTVGVLHPFSRLTAHAQEEVLSHPSEVSLAECRKFNPWLNSWRGLKPSLWPARASRLLSPQACAERLWHLIEAEETRGAWDAVQIQNLFLQQRLGSLYLYPNLMTEEFP